MQRFHRSLAACFTVLAAGAGCSQLPAQRHEPAPKAVDTTAIPPAAAARRAEESALRSAFPEYRRFKPDEPLVDWRAANEEVKNAGGHVGLMRARGAPDDRGSADRKAAAAKGHHR